MLVHHMSHHQVSFPARFLIAFSCVQQYGTHCALLAQHHPVYPLGPNSGVSSSCRTTTPRTHARTRSTAPQQRGSSAAATLPC